MRALVYIRCAGGLVGWLLVGDSHKVGRLRGVVLTRVCKCRERILIRRLELTYWRDSIQHSKKQAILKADTAMENCTEKWGIRQNFFEWD